LCIYVYRLHFHLSVLTTFLITYLKVLYTIFRLCYLGLENTFVELN